MKRNASSAAAVVCALVGSAASLVLAGEITTAGGGYFCRDGVPFYPIGNFIVVAPFSTNATLPGASLPSIVDFDVETHLRGGLSLENEKLPKTAFTAGECSDIPYSLVTPEGLSVYKKLWQDGARRLLARGWRPYAYELFDEPIYHDLSFAADAAFARSEFAKRIPPDAPAVARDVERMKFEEKCFADVMKKGREYLREVDPNARTCFHPHGFSFGYVNILGANETTDVVMAPSGTDYYDAHLCLAVAGDRPIVDGEICHRQSRFMHRALVLREFARGFNASYEEHDFTTCAPDAAEGLRDAAAEIAEIQDLFRTRRRGVVREVAFLVSQPSERLRRAKGLPNSTRTREVALALLAARLPFKAIFEEQLDSEHLAGVKVIVAAGVDATLPATNDRLRLWVENGGTLLTIEEKLDRTEWGERSPNAFVTGRDCLFGKGRLIHLAKRPDAREAPAFFRDMAEKLGIYPSCRIASARTHEERFGVGLAAARTEDGACFILLNNDLTPHVLRLTPVAVGASFANWYNVSTKKRVPRAKDGDLLLKILPEEALVIRTDKPGVEVKPGETAEEFFANADKWRFDHKKKVSTEAFKIDYATAEPLSLYEAANGSLADRFGEMPEGRHVYEGVPFKLVRANRNEGKTCVLLDRGEATLESRGFVRAVDVLFSAPDGATGPLFDMELGFADGTHSVITFEAPGDTKVYGWRNSSGRGLFQARRFTTYPELESKTIRLKPRQKGVAVAAVTIERVDINPYVADLRLEALRIVTWGGLNLSRTGDVLTMHVDDRTDDWAGVSASLSRPLKISAADVAKRSLVFQVNLSDLSSGPATQPVELPQVSLVYEKTDGTRGHGPYVFDPEAEAVDTDPETWQEIRIPLWKLITGAAIRDEAVEVRAVYVQLRPFGSQRASLALRTMHIE